MVVWEDKYSTGIAELDSQHQVLFKYINNLEKIIEKGDYSFSRIENILTFFEDYAKNHFGYEEDCMHAHQCPFGGKNKAAHKEFIKIFDAFHHRFTKEGPSEKLLKEIQQKATDWLVNHICKIDVNLKSCVKK